MENNEIKGVNQPIEEKTLSSETENIATKENYKTPIYKKWWFWVIIGVVVIAIIFGGGSSDSSTDNQGSGSSQGGTGDKTNLGDYHIEILSCRVVKGYSNKDVGIVTYIINQRILNLTFPLRLKLLTSSIIQLLQ